MLMGSSWSLVHMINTNTHNEEQIGYNSRYKYVHRHTMYDFDHPIVVFCYNNSPHCHRHEPIIITMYISWKGPGNEKFSNLSYRVETVIYRTSCHGNIVLVVYIYSYMNMNCYMFL